jgi:hypothetical protein
MNILGKSQDANNYDIESDSAVHAECELLL